MLCVLNFFPFPIFSSKDHLGATVEASSPMDSDSRRGFKHLPCDPPPCTNTTKPLGQTFCETEQLDAARKPGTCLTFSRVLQSWAPLPQAIVAADDQESAMIG